MPAPLPAAAPEAYRETAAAVNNWGRWGPDDRIGTLNLVDEAARRRAAAAVVDGRAVALGLPLSAAEGIQLGFIPGRTNPERSMICVNEPIGDDPAWIASSEDIVSLATQCATHWDGLAHVSVGGKLWNGYDAATVTEAGATVLGIHHVRTLVSRGILLDLPRTLGVEILEPGYPVTPDDLDRAVDRAGVDVLPGDVVLVRTGQAAHLALRGRPGLGGAAPVRDLVAYTWPTPGLTMATARWFRERDVAAVATDTMVLEVYPCERDDLYLPVHLLHLVEMGMTQGQNWFLDELADACAADGRATFLLDATPLPLTDELGSPVNPVAVR